MIKNLKIVAGTVFAVPLQDEGFALGLAARVSPGAGVKTIFGYFFGERYAHVPSIEALPILASTGAIHSSRFSGLGIKNGTWTILGIYPEWDAADWPMPYFARKSLTSRDVFITAYDNKNPGKRLGQRLGTASEAADLPRDGLEGYGAVEIVLTRLINGEPIYY